MAAADANAPHDARVSVLGAGSFGTALAHHLGALGHDVVLWCRRPAQAAAAHVTGRNPDYLPELTLGPRVRPTADLAAAVRHAAWILVAIPAQALRAGLTALQPLLDAQPLVLAAKGLEDGTLMTVTEVACDVLGAAARPRLAVLSGPSFAAEVAAGEPTAVVLAAFAPALAARLAPRLFCPTFRAYRADDVVGVEMGGALKNVMAIAAGALAGMGLGENTRAAMVTRGIAEMGRLALAKGGRALTLAGLAGVGDLVLTCTGAQSRNRAVGVALGQGMAAAAACAQVRQVAEGVRTTRAAHALAARLGVHAPITAAVHAVLFEGVAARAALAAITRRPPGQE